MNQSIESNIPIAASGSDHAFQREEESHKKSNKTLYVDEADMTAPRNSFQSGIIDKVDNKVVRSD